MKSVRDSILLFRGEFCHSFPRSVLWQKERIIPKAILATRRKIYRSFTIPFTNKHVSVSVHKRHGRVKTRRTIFPWHILELFEQLGVVFGIISVLSGIAGRIDLRSTIQRIDTQSRIIRNGRKKRCFIECRQRLDKCVVAKISPRFLRFRKITKFTEGNKGYTRHDA